MKRQLFNAGAGVSLVLGLVTRGLWARSYWRFDELMGYTPNNTTIEFMSGAGKFTVVIWPDEDWIPTEWEWTGESATGVRPALRNLTFDWTFSSHMYAFELPYWAPFLSFAGVSGCGVARMRRTRLPASHCPACGLRPPRHAFRGRERMPRVRGGLFFER